MPRIEGRTRTGVLLVVVYGVILLLDLVFNGIPRVPTPAYSGGNPWAQAFGFYLGNLVIVPGLAVFGWPLGLWFWRYALLQQGAIERTIPRIIAVACWLLALLMVFGIVRSWLLA